MKAKDLIELLKEYPEDAEVGILDLENLNEEEQEHLIFSMESILLPKQVNENDDVPLSRYAYVINKTSLIFDKADSEVYYAKIENE